MVESYSKTGALGVLQDLSIASSSTRSSSRTTGRYARTPTYEAPASKSSRPNTGAGVTFHFAHKSISKKNDISEGSSTMTSASAHQGYIERKEAGAEIGDLEKKILEKRSAERQTEESPIKEEGGFKRPALSWSEDRAGFGNIGETKAQRADFWKEVEGAESRHGRVQSRIVAELPHETTPAERMKIAVEFCKTLDNEGLPYWASIHAPTKKNDARNYHLHIAYYDRPAGVSDDGKWDFSHEEIKVKKSRNKVKFRPYKKDKSLKARQIGWVKELRAQYAKNANDVLQDGGYEKRMDHRSYKEAGVLKEPTRHLGFKANAMESFGLETEVGQDNARKEYRWRASQRVRRWDRALAQEEVMALFSQDGASDDFFEISEKRQKKIEEGKSLAMNGINAEILHEQISLRVGKRQDFLEKEGQRLMQKGRGFLIAQASDDISSIFAEREILNTRKDEIDFITQGLSETARQSRIKEAMIWSEISLEKKQIDLGSLDVFKDDGLFSTPFITGTTNKEKEDMPWAQKTIFENDVENDNALDDFFTPSRKQDHAVIVEKKEDDKSIPDVNQDTNIVLKKEAKDFQISQKVDGIFLVEKPKNAKDISDLDETLKAMTNKEVRLLAIGTRDMVDVSEVGPQRESANRGWVILRMEAARRGVNLETGAYLPSKATDKERAELHKDEYIRTVLQLRQEVINVKVK